MNGIRPTLLLTRGSGCVGEERLTGEGRKCVEILPDDFEILVRDICETNADSESRSSMSDFAFRPGLGLSEPDGHSELRTDFHGDRQFGITSANAEIGDRAPEGSTIKNVDLNRVLTAIAWCFAILGGADLIRISGGSLQGKIPQRLPGRNVQQAQVSGPGCVWFAHPFHTKMNAIRSVGETNDFIDRKIGLNAGNLYPMATDVYGDSFLGKDGTGAVGSEDAHWDLDVFSGLAALSHPE